MSLLTVMLGTAEFNPSFSRCKERNPALRVPVVPKVSIHGSQIKRGSVESKLESIETIYRDIKSGSKTRLEIMESTNLGRSTVMNYLIELMLHGRITRTKTGKHFYYAVTKLAS